MRSKAAPRSRCDFASCALAPDKIYDGAEERERCENMRASKSAALALNFTVRTAAGVQIARSGERNFI